MSQLQNPEKVDSPDPSPSPTLGENSDNDFDLKDDSADGPSENDQGVVGVFSSYRGFFEASEEEIWFSSRCRSASSASGGETMVVAFRMGVLE